MFFLGRRALRIFHFVSDVCVMKIRFGFYVVVVVVVNVVVVGYVSLIQKFLIFFGKTRFFKISHVSHFFAQNILQKTKKKE